MRFDFGLWLGFVVGAIISWGIYVPVLHEGQTELGGGKPSAGSARAFLCVGLAYVLIAVVIPLVLFSLDMTAGEKLDFSKNGAFNMRGLAFALFGGIAGAMGALCIVLAFKNGGKPLFVAPLVFAGAPIVNAVVSLLWHPPEEGSPDWKFFAGIVMAAVGAGLVLYSKAELDMKKPKTHTAAKLVSTNKPSAETGS